MFITYYLDIYSSVIMSIVVNFLLKLYYIYGQLKSLILIHSFFFEGIMNVKSILKLFLNHFLSSFQVVI